MNKINILYTGRHPEILETVVRLINQNENWNGFGASSNEEAINLFTTINFTIVLLGCGIPEDEEKQLRDTFAAINPECPVIQHYGGGSGLLSNEIYAALAKANV
ncbi:hypothetical protein [Flavobacterium suzhouense]|uniref:Uncharacterized protein n=1 Tax=Flavobacterium suzhouense TaxID=1529638 RepID=A0ABW5NWD5_9FLAO